MRQAFSWALARSPGMGARLACFWDSGLVFPSTGSGIMRGRRARGVLARDAFGLTTLPGVRTWPGSRWSAPVSFVVSFSYVRRRPVRTT